MLGLYVHIPFCSAICNYCNFNRGLFDGDQKARYVEALITEIDRAGLTGSATPAVADTIYFGGGTPSLLEPSEVARIIAACRDAFDVSSAAEVTLEANPESVDPRKLSELRDAGINRLSFGVQSFRDAELRRLSRLHDANRARAALREARGAGFDNVSLDLMMWLPSQRVDDWLESVDAAIESDPDHLSLYLLEVYPNAPLKDEMARAQWSQAPDDDAATMYVTAMERLEAAGLAQYEISNVAKPGRASRHNLKYWTDGEWRGFGCGAHGTIAGVRTKNVSAIDDYIQRLAKGQPVASDVRRMDPAERLGDALFTGLRLTRGIDMDAVQQRYGVDIWETYRADLTPFVDAGLLTRDGSRLALTRAGMLLANEVMAVFV
jgi:oxygen-independent coproporphyrinogen-3 oxidase